MLGLGVSKIQRKWSIFNAIQFVFLLSDTPKCHNLKSNLSLNERASFDCEVTYNGNQPPRLSWKHDKQNLTNSYRSESDPDLPNKTEVVTTYFTALREYDGFVYGCHVTYPNTDFQYLCQARKKLNIFFPVEKPSIKVVPYYNGTNKKFQSGTNILLLCMAEGHPHPKYRWEFLPLNEKGSSRMTLSTIAHYKINNAHSNSMGNYTCIASNKVNDKEYNRDSTVFIQISKDSKSNSKVNPHSPLPNPQYRVSDSNKGRPEHRYPKQEVGDIHMSPYAVGALASAGLAIVLVVVFIMLAIKFRAREKRLREKFSRTYDEMMDDQEQELLDDNIQPTGVDETQGQYGRMRQYWEIPRKDVRLMDVLATGSYCEVWRAKMKKNSDSKDITKVAVKKVLDDASEQGRKFFLAEMEVLKMLKTHPSVIKLIGCYTLNEPWMLMVEYAKEGTLQKYLQKHRPGEQEVQINNVNEQSVHMKTTNNKLDAHRLLVLAAQVVSGLLHLQKFKLIYYRLSASSVLVSKCGICKLSGFGFPQDVTERNLYEKDSYPIRWMAPESLKDRVFTVKSDVWAYGILVWEILNFGMKPYHDIESNDSVQDQVLSGYRLPQPTHCSTEL
ncbi:hypothetical protein FSP39_013946 [Pinctada imbricata]|uniref:Uncharacterized protein n=1 Tax=Pinctada imbricata TaxID=66713 RepID=A0AA88YW54_PINIB|nr:hypothetical protein FSP39_013946 [Pinctada imbricata]